jgi:hypothetical protein
VNNGNHGLVAGINIDSAGPIDAMLDRTIRQNNLGAAWNQRRPVF